MERQGCLHACFRRHCQALVKLHKPSLLVLLKTKMKKYRALTSSLGYESHIQSSVQGVSKGIVIMWNNILSSWKICL